MLTSEKKIFLFLFSFCLKIKIKKILFSTYRSCCWSHPLRQLPPQYCLVFPFSMSHSASQSDRLEIFVFTREKKSLSNWEWRRIDTHISILISFNWKQLIVCIHRKGNYARLYVKPIVRIFFFSFSASIHSPIALANAFIFDYIFFSSLSFRSDEHYIIPLHFFFFLRFIHVCKHVCYSVYDGHIDFGAEI